MKPFGKSGLLVLLFAALLFTFYYKCCIHENPCEQCTTVTPAFIETDNGLIVRPPALPDITGTIITVTRLADSTLYIPVDTIKPGGYRLIPVNLDSTGINVQLEYLTPGGAPDNSDGRKYCKTSTDFPTTLGVIVMDVVMERSDTACNPPGCGNIFLINQNIVYMDHPQAGYRKLISVNGVNLYFEVIDMDSVKIYYCDSNITGINYNPSTKTVTVSVSGGTTFTVRSEYDSDPDKIAWYIYCSSNCSIGQCTGVNHQ